MQSTGHLYMALHQGLRLSAVAAAGWFQCFVLHRMQQQACPRVPLVVLLLPLLVAAQVLRA
jgi:hypothetical protein